ncbi:MAG: HD domain-containing protein [Treponema sp.]|jgi:GTP pyrophosphokinase|nr:HD domain-containing protein [Treponema sp.]
MEGEISKFREKIQPYGQREQERIEKALSVALAEEAESSPGTADPVRLTGIASILIELNLDSDTVAAALLLGKSGNASPNEGTEERFGRHVALLVEEVRKIGDISARNKTIQEAENIRKMLFAMTTDIRVIFIKLAERLYAMRAGDSLPTSPEQSAGPADEASSPTPAEPAPGEIKALARECLDIYAPLAGRLGISWIKDELEDLALKRLNRDIYNQIKKIVSERRGERAEFLSRVQGDIRRETAALGISIEVSSRAKHFYSIYQKMRKRNKATGDLYDLFGIRILCDSIENCYTLLGLVHRLWKPLDGRFKDYIAMPKSNGYQSLHTTVFVPEAVNENPASGIPEKGAGGRMLEIQIRTWEMHHIAEYGIASHWLYKKGSTHELVRPVDISIMNRLRDWKQMEDGRKNGMDIRNSKSFLEDIKRELLKDSIYVFTPQGKVIELPVGAGPIDFAYSIHSAVGEHCIGAKADGSIIPLSSELRNTQVVEILTSPRAHPHLNWLRIVKTAKARGKIRTWLEQNDDSIIIERNVVAKKKPGSQQETSLPPAVPVKEIPMVQRVPPDPAVNDVLQVRVESGRGSYEKNVMIRFARCCRPVIGDPIVGYVSRGRGIIVHRKNCGNLANIPDFEERKIDTEWENAVSVLVRRFKINAKLSADLFSEIEGAVRKYQGHLIEGRLEETAANRLTGFFTMQLEQAGDLKKVIKNIRGIPGVLNIQPI